MDSDPVDGFDVMLDPYGDASEGGAPVRDEPVLDAVDSVVVSGAMMAVHAAEQLRSVDLMRTGAMARAAREGNRLTDVIERSVRLELAAALGITEYAAGELFAKAEALVHRHPMVLESLHRARFTPRHAYDLVDAVDGVEPELRGQVLSARLTLAEAHPVGVFRRKLRVLVESVRAVTLAERHERALARRRRVVVEPAEDGMAWLSLFLAAVEAHAIHGRATAIAKVLAKHPEETRTPDQLRADVLGDLLVDGVTDTLPAEARGIRPTVVVTVPVLALLETDAKFCRGREGRVRVGGGCRSDPERAGARAVWWGGGVDAGPHASRDRNGALGRAGGVPATGGLAATGPVEIRDLHGTRMRHPRVTVRDRPHDRLGTQRAHIAA